MGRFSLLGLHKSWRSSFAPYIRGSMTRWGMTVTGRVLAVAGYQGPWARLALPKMLTTSYSTNAAGKNDTTKRSTQDAQATTSTKFSPEPQTEPSYTSSVSEAAAEGNEKPLPFLSKPLGVSKRPTPERLSWGERHAEWFDRDARLEKRRLMYVHRLF